MSRRFASNHIETVNIRWLPMVHHYENFPFITFRDKSPIFFNFFNKSTVILLTVPPKLAPFATNDEPLHLGDYFQLTCAVVHGDFPYNITWYFNDEPITYFDGVSILMHGKRSSSLNIESVSAQHSGNYSCKGSNRAGQASITSTLSIRGLCTFSHKQFYLQFWQCYYSVRLYDFFIVFPQFY